MHHFVPTQPLMAPLLPSPFPQIISYHTISNMALFHLPLAMAWSQTLWQVQNLTSYPNLEKRMMMMMVLWVKPLQQHLVSVSLTHHYYDSVTGLLTRLGLGYSVGMYERMVEEQKACLQSGLRPKRRAHQVKTSQYISTLQIVINISKYQAV